jgi:hypothetical protein
MLSRPQRPISVRQTRACDLNLIAYLLKVCLFVCLMVFNTTFSNISVISWRSVLLVEETGGPGDYHRPVASHWQTLSHNVVHLVLIEIRTRTISGDSHSSVVIATDCIGSCKYPTTIRSRPNDGPAKSWFKHITSNTNLIQQIITTVSSWMKRNSLGSWPTGGWSSLL